MTATLKVQFTVLICSHPVNFNLIEQKEVVFKVGPHFKQSLIANILLLFLRWRCLKPIMLERKHFWNWLLRKYQFVLERQWNYFLLLRNRLTLGHYISLHKHINCHILLVKVRRMNLKGDMKIPLSGEQFVEIFRETLEIRFFSELV